MTKQRRKLPFINAVWLFLLAQGCSCMARGPAQYKDDTRAVLAERNPQIKECYDEALKMDRNAEGNVVVSFTVEKKTGVFKDVKVVESESDAPEALQQCVLKALEGLALVPNDERDGQATFTWTFKDYTRS